MGGSNGNRRWILGDREMAELARLAASPTITEGVRRRVQIVCSLTEGGGDSSVAMLLGVNSSTVGRVRRRYAAAGFDGLYDEERPGRPRAVTDRQVEDLLRLRGEQPPPGTDHWSYRSIGTQSGLAKSTVHRELVEADRRARYVAAPSTANQTSAGTCCLLVGIYLDPPHVAAALCSLPQSAAQPLSTLLKVKGSTYAYVTSRVTSVGTALDIANGTTEGLALPHYRYRGLVEFLQRVRDALPTVAPVHVIMSTDAMYRHYRMREWLPKQPWLGLRYADGYADWLDHLMEWFPTMTRRVLSPRERSSVVGLATKVDYFVQHYSRGRTPFSWVVDQDEAALGLSSSTGAEGERDAVIG